VSQPKHYVVHRHPHEAHEDAVLCSEDEYDDEEMMKSSRGGGRGRKRKTKGGWGLWYWLSGGS